MNNIPGAVLWNKQTTYKNMGDVSQKMEILRNKCLAIKNQIPEIQTTSDRGISRLDTAKEIISELKGMSV